MTSLYVNNLLDLNESNTVSFYNFIKKKLSKTLSKMPNPFELDENTDENYNFLKNYKMQLIYSKMKLYIKNTNDFELFQENSTFTLLIFIPYKLYNLLTEKKKRGHIFLGELPLLTENSTFFVNNSDRVIINQLVRNPGVYFQKGTTFNKNPYITIISTKGDVTNIDLIPQVPLKFKNLSKKSFRFLNDSKKLFFDFSERVLENESTIKNNFLISNHLLHIGKKGREELNKKLNLKKSLTQEHITSNDLKNIYYFFLKNKNFNNTELDFLDFNNRYVKTLDIFLENIVEENFNDYIIILKTEYLKIQRLIKKKKATSIINDTLLHIKESFLKNTLTQYADQTNPLSLLSHTRRMTVFGPAGISKDNIPKELNNIQFEQYGRICPIETVDGKESGLISSLALLSKIDICGNILEPYLIKTHSKNLVVNSSIFLTTNEEKELFISFDSENNKFFNTFAKKNNLITKIKFNNINLYYNTPLQFFSLSIALIPFLEHNDLTRMQMAASMEKQAIPLLFPEINIVGTNIETSMSTSSGFAIQSYNEGIITASSSFFIECIDSYYQKITYPLLKNTRLNQKSLLIYKPTVWIGEKIFNSQIIASGSGISEGEVSLGNNIIVGYIPWEGYNYEDGIVISENLILNEFLTSAHLIEYDVSYIDLTLMALTFNYILKTNDPSFLDNYEKVVEIRNIYYPETEKKKQLDLINNLLRIYTVKLKRIQIGDKLAGRYGNKGVVTKILPIIDMPFLVNGLKIDLMFNPLGIPSRMNIGQLFESLLAFSGSAINKHYKITPFNEFWEDDKSEILLNQALKKTVTFTKQNWYFKHKSIGKFKLKDGQNGVYLDNNIMVGKNYILKLIHLVSEKYTVRSSNPYKGIFSQPTTGKQLKGGQRFGEMETWALEAHGTFFTLREFLTLKSDSIKSRKVFKHLKKNPYQYFSLSEISYSASFLSFIHEISSIGINLDLKKFVI